MAVILLAALAVAARRRWKWALALGLVCALVALSLPSFRDRLAVTLRDASNPNALLSDRLPLWETAARVIARHPLTGIGYGSEIYQQDVVRELWPMFNYKFQPHAHNFYLQTASEGGVLHLAGIIGFFVGFLFLARGFLRERGPGGGFDFALALGVFAAVASMLLYGFVGHFHETRIAEALWCAVALAGAPAAAALGESGKKSV